MKLKRILALTGAILLAGMFILAIVLAVIGAPMNYLMAVIFSMMFVSIIFYAMGLMTRVLKPSDPSDAENGAGGGKGGTGGGMGRADGSMGGADGGMGNADGSMGGADGSMGGADGGMGGTGGADNGV